MPHIFFSSMQWFADIFLDLIHIPLWLAQKLQVSLGPQPILGCPGAYYHGTNWYGSSMMTTVEPWSGHYEVNPVIWATAHFGQLTCFLTHRAGKVEV